MVILNDEKPNKTVGINKGLGYEVGFWLNNKALKNTQQGMEQKIVSNAF
jgi:hypothetical protein